MILGEHLHSNAKPFHEEATLFEGDVLLCDEGCE